MSDNEMSSVEQGRTAINAALKTFLSSKRVQSSFAPLDHHIFEDFQEFVLGGGKRFRPLLVLSAWEGFGPGRIEDFDVPVGVGVALELFHTFLLIHDDIIDDADTRRGGATLREMFAQRYPGRRGLKTFADHLALVVGDICFTLALEHMNDLPVPDGLRHKLVGELLKYARLTGVGQVLDVASAIRPAGGLDPKQIELCYDLKTGQYTIECPLVLGAILAEADASVFEVLRRYARALGVAYQISDDLIGVSRLQGEKSGTLDFEQGRQTLLLAMTLNNTSPRESLWLNSRFGQGPLTEKDAEKLVSIYWDSKAVEQLEEKIESLRYEALSAVGELGSGKGVLRLESLVIQLVPDK